MASAATIFYTASVQRSNGTLGHLGRLRALLRLIIRQWHHLVGVGPDAISSGSAQVCQPGRVLNAFTPEDSRQALSMAERRWLLRR
jgi:hypothetical protein